MGVAICATELMSHAFQQTAGAMHRRPVLLITRLRWAHTASRCSSSQSELASTKHSRLRKNREDLLHKRVTAVELARTQLEGLQGQQQRINSFLRLRDAHKACSAQPCLVAVQLARL